MMAARHHSEHGRSGLLRQFLWLFTSRVLGALLQAAFLLQAAATAGPSMFGLISAVVGALMAASALMDFGVGTFLTRARASSPLSPLVNAGLRLNLLSALLLGVISATCMAALGFVVDTRFWQLLPLAVWVSAEKVSDGWLSLAVADGDTRENTLSVLVRRVSAVLVFTVLLVLSNGPVALMFSIASMVSAALGVIVTTQRLRRRIPSRNSAALRRVFRLAWPYWINTAATQLRNLDSAIVASVASTAVAGIYGVPSRLTSPLRMIPTTLAQIALPAAARGGRAGMTQLIRAIFIVMGLMTAILGGVLLGAPLAPLVLGRAYTDAVLPIQILAAGLWFASLCSFGNSLLQGRGRPSYVAAVSTATTLFALSAIGLGALLGGAVGATLGLSSSFVLQLSLLLGPALRTVRAFKKE